MAEVRRAGDRMMTVVLVFGEDVLRLICWHSPQSGRKTVFYDELKGECDIHNDDDLVMCLSDFNGHVDKDIDGLDLVHGWYVWHRSEEFERKNVTSFVWKKNYVRQIHGLENRKRGKIHSECEKMRQIDFVLWIKEHWRLIGNVKAIPLEYQQSLVVAMHSKFCCLSQRIATPG